MPQQIYKVKIDSRLAAVARELHQVSRVGGPLRGRGESFESYLSDLVTTAIVERKQPCASVVLDAKKTVASTGTIAV